MAEENRLWGAERIRGELLKLGITVAKRTIQKYLPKERHPTDQTWATFLKNHADWMAQQMRELSPWSEGSRFLICDNDAVFGETFEETAMKMGTEVVHTPFYTPQANGHCERLVGSVRRECLDRMLIFHERHLQRVVKEYTTYYNTSRPHQGIRQKIPTQFSGGAAIVENVGKGQPLFVSPFLNGLHHSYSWTAPQN